MLALLLAASLTATPRPLPKADSGVYVPDLSKMGGLIAFMERAGERSTLMRPQTWFSEFHPLMYVDFTRPETLEAAGILRSGDATVSYRNDGRMTCVTVAPGDVYEEKLRARIASFGQVWEGRRRGVPVVAAKGPDGRFVAGHARRGNVSCAVAATMDADELLDEAAQAVRKPRVGGPWNTARTTKGAAVLVMKQGVFGLDAEGNTLHVSGWTDQLATPALVRDGASPYATMAPTGLFVARAGVKPGQVPVAVRSLTSALGDLCRSCAKEDLQAIQTAIARALTGHVALNVHRAEVKGRLSTPAERFFAAKHVWLAEVKSAEAADAALARVAKLEGARAIEGGHAIPVQGGEVQVGVRGRHLFVANDAEALRATLRAVPEKSGKMAHGLTFALDPAKASSTLAQISLFDVMGSKELAGLFALSTELGPLLGVSRSLTGWADTAGERSHRFGLSWTLKP